MLRIEVINTETNERLQVGTLEDFINGITEEIGSVTTVMTKAGFRKKTVSAFDRLFQKVRDEKRRK